MRVLVLGGNGMLGHQVARVLETRMDTAVSVRGSLSDYPGLDAILKARILEGVSAERFETVEMALTAFSPDVVVNAIGIVKQRDEATQAIPSIAVNSLFPHLLARSCADRGARLMHMSTDCVFSGLRGDYTESDLPDPVDLYGRTKLIGEVNRPNCLTIRTSIIGWELGAGSSLLEWFASKRGSRVKGYRKAIFTGLSTSVLARLMADLVETRPDVAGLYHIASQPISKYDLLIQLASRLGWDSTLIEPDDQFHCDRSLNSTRFLVATGWRAPAWGRMIAGLAEEWIEYERHRSTEK